MTKMRGDPKAPLLYAEMRSYWDSFKGQKVPYLGVDEDPGHQQIDERHHNCELVVMTRARYESLRKAAISDRLVT